MTGDPELLPPEDITRIFREGERFREALKGDILQSLLATPTAG